MSKSLAEGAKDNPQQPPRITGGSALSETLAITTITDALIPLSDEARRRVVNFAIDYFQVYGERGRYG